MKKWLWLSFLSLSVCGCGQASSSTPPKTFSYEIGTPVVETYTDNSTDWSRNFIRAYAPITNTGETLIAIGSCTMDVFDNEGAKMQTLEFFDCYPNILRPGETAYIHEETVYEGTSLTGLRGEGEYAVREIEGVRATRYQIDQVTLVDHETYGFEAEVDIANDSSSSSSWMYVVVDAFDKQGAYYATLWRSRQIEVPPGGSCRLTAANNDVEYRPVKLSKEGIGHYQAYAYEYEWVLWRN